MAKKTPFICSQMLPSYTEFHAFFPHHCPFYTLFPHVTGGPPLKPTPLIVLSYSLLVNAPSCILSIFLNHLKRIMFHPLYHSTVHSLCILCHTKSLINPLNNFFIPLVIPHAPFKSLISTTWIPDLCGSCPCFGCHRSGSGGL